MVGLVEAYHYQTHQTERMQLGKLDDQISCRLKLFASVVVSAALMSAAGMWPHQ